MAKQELLKKYCNCGALVWDVPHKGYLPRFSESIFCPGCGSDHSRKPSFAFLLRFARRRFKRRLRLYGKSRVWSHLGGLFEVRPGGESGRKLNSAGC